MNLSLDIDGVLLDYATDAPAENATIFIDYITREFDCHWLTTHCQWDSAAAVEYLAENLFLANDDGVAPVLIGMYKNGVLIKKEKFSFTIVPDKHACGLNGFKEHLKSIITDGMVIRIVAPLYDDFDFDITTTKMQKNSNPFRAVGLWTSDEPILLSLYIFLYFYLYLR